MTFEFDTPEESAFRASIRKLARQEIPKFQNEKFYNSVPQDLWSSLAKAGLAGLRCPEEFGGLDAGQSQCCVVYEELAAVDLGPAIFLSVHNMVCSLLSRFASKEMKEKYVSDLASGKKLAAFALSETQAGSDAAGLKARAEKCKEGYRLNGDKAWISSAGYADLYLVFARTGDNDISAFIVESEAKGLKIGKPEKKMGCELSPIAALEFQDLLLPETALVGELGEGLKIALSGLAGGRVSIASCAVGISRTAILRTKEYLAVRKQFGKALEEFQGLQFMLADMQIAFEASRMLTWRAAQALDSQEITAEQKRLHSSIAKCQATDACMKISTDAVQLFGANGYVKEPGIEKLMRDAKMLQIVEGANQIQRSIIARLGLS